MLAGGAVGHVVVELEIAVELGLDVDRPEGELVDRPADAERGRLPLVRRADAANDLLAKSAAAEAAAPAAALILTLPAAELEVVVVEEVAKVKVVKAEARLLLVGTLVVDVGRASERRGVAELPGVSICKSCEGLRG